MLYYEDFYEGQVQDFGDRTVSEEEVIAFAKQYDPQPMHLDAEAAKDSMLGGLAASGWHTAGMLMRMMVDGLIRGTASMGAPGVEELRWEKPVRPGDKLHARRTVLSMRTSASRPEMGLIKSRFELFNQDGERVLDMVSTGMVGRKSEAAQ